MSVERIARALEGIPHAPDCEHGDILLGESPDELFIERCTCDRGVRQAAAVLEALELGIANAGGVSIVTGREVAIRALERIAGSPLPKEEPNEPAR